MSTLVVSNISDGTTTVGASYVTNGSAKAWLKYDQVSVAIDDSLNTSSVTDQAVGNFYQNITNAFTSADYATSGCGYESNSNATTNILSCDYEVSSSSQTRWWVIVNSSSSNDSISSSSTFGNLA